MLLETRLFLYGGIITNAAVFVIRLATFSL